MTALDWMKRTPIAHRGLHDKANGRFENTLSAARAAADAGYSIEVDLHPSRDGVPMVFHDDTLDRLTARKGAMRALDASELGTISIGGTADTIPTLAQLLDLVAGRVGLVLELKGIEGKDDGFVAAVLKVLQSYRGPVAIMSFDHWLIADARRLGAQVPVGLTAEGGEEARAIHERAVQAWSPDFLSYGITDLPVPFVTAFRATGRPVITWTIRTPADAEKSARHADQITFEGFLPPLPA